MTKRNTVKCLIITLFKGKVAQRVTDCIGEAGRRYLVLPMEEYFPHVHATEGLVIWASERLLQSADHRDYEYCFARVIDIDNFNGKRWTGPPYQGFPNEPGHPEAALVGR